MDESQIYALYKTRQEIEQNFKCYDDTLDPDASFMQDQDAFGGGCSSTTWPFRCCTVSSTTSLRQPGGKYSFKDVVRTLKGIRANKINGQWRLSLFTKNIRKHADLNIEIDDPLVG